MKKIVLITIILASVFYVSAQDSLYINKTDATIIPYAIADLDSAFLETSADSLYIHKIDATIISYAIANVDSITFLRKGIVLDTDGNLYQTVTIGNQTWMVENLKVTHYNDGTPIPNVTDKTEWVSLLTGAYCNYEDSEYNGDVYGRLYNWYAVETGNLAPEGWHVATAAEWDTLKTYLIDNGYDYDGNVDGEKIGKALASTTHWAESVYFGNVGCQPQDNNSTGFTALPGGARNYTGSYQDLHDVGRWWTATGYKPEYAYARDIGFYYPNLQSNGFLKYMGFSVRCIKD